MIFPYSLIQKILFSIDPEKAHNLTLNILKNFQKTPFSRIWRQPTFCNPVILAGLKFPNRVGLAAGFDKNAQCIDALGSMGFGFIEVGTVTPLAQPGQAKPRIFRLREAKAIINRLGFNNIGIEKTISNIQASKERASFYSKKTLEINEKQSNSMLLGINIGKNANTPIENAANDYVISLRAAHAHADYITVNISSPNTENLRSLQKDEALDKLLRTITMENSILTESSGRKVPLFLKIAPDMEEIQIDAVATSLKLHQMDGVIATNTTLARFNIQGIKHSQELGGLSGQPLQQKSNEVISQLRERLGAEFPIIGVGGILSADDALSKIAAGADIIQIYTGLVYKGPRLVKSIATAFQNINIS